MSSRPQGGSASLEADAAHVERIFDASPFRGLAGDARRALLGLFALERLPLRHVFARPGASAARRLLLIGEGRVRVERRGSGARPVPLGDRGPGETVGEEALVPARPPVEVAVVVDAVVGLVAPAAAVRAVAAARPEVREAVVDRLVAVRAAAEARLIVLLRCDVRARLADVLLGALARWGAPHAQGELVAAPFTHAHLAALVGSTRETTTVVLAGMRADGLIAFDRRRIVVPSRAALAACVAGA